MPIQTIAFFVSLALLHGDEAHAEQASSVGICWTRNEVDPRQKDTTLAITDFYALSEAARSARQADSTVQLCIFTNFPQTRFEKVLGLALGEDDARNLFDLVLPSANISEPNSLLPSDLARSVQRIGRVLSALRKQHGRAKNVPVNMQAALQRMTVFASRIGRMINMMRAPYTHTLFLDDDVYLCKQEQQSQPSLSAWLRAYFEDPRGPDIRLSSFDLSRGIPPEHGIRISRRHVACVDKRCSHACNGKVAATTACLACKTECDDNWHGEGAAGASSPRRSVRFYGHTIFSPQAGAVALRGGFGSSNVAAVATAVSDGSVHFNTDNSTGPARPSQLLSSEDVRHFFSDWMRVLLNESGVYDRWDVLPKDGSRTQADHNLNVGNSGSGSFSAEHQPFDMQLIDRLMPLVNNDKKFGKDQGPLRRLLELASEADACRRTAEDSDGCLPSTLKLSLKWSIGELSANFNKRPSTHLSPEVLSTDALHFQQSMEPASPLWGPLHVIHDERITTTPRGTFRKHPQKEFRENRRAHSDLLCACANANLELSPWRLVYLARKSWVPGEILMHPPPQNCAEYRSSVYSISLPEAMNTDDWTNFVVRVNETRVAEEILASGKTPPCLEGVVAPLLSRT